MIQFVVADTQVFIAMFCFPRRVGDARLAHDLFDALQDMGIALMMTRRVWDEVQDVAQRNIAFAHHFAKVQEAFAEIPVIDTPLVDIVTYEAIAEICTDDNDIDVMAEALACKQTVDYTYFVSNDFENFHTDRAKAYLQQHGITPVSMYGLLKLLGKRS